MLHRRATTLLSIALLTVALAALPSAATAAQSCGTIKLGTRTYVFYKGGLSCDRAKTLARGVYRTRKAPTNWRCTSGSRYRSGANCTSGRRYFGWHPGD